MSNTPKAVIAGIDEAGRGPLAGPVVAGACVLLCRPKRGIRIADSKTLTSELRESAYAWIIGHSAYGIGSASADLIDSIGILEATSRAMQEAVAMLAQTITPTYLLIDGRDKFWFDYPHSSIIRGDSLEPAISAASIIAKVTRDRFMIDAAKEFPLYGFAGHKGYGSPDHIEAIKKFGPCKLHRKSFLRNILGGSAATILPSSPLGRGKR